MGGAGFGQGLVQGMQAAQDRQMQMAHLKLQKDLHAHQLKALETEDELKGLQLQSLQRKIEAETRLPSMQENVLGIQPVQPLLEWEQGAMPMPDLAPEIDRHKLVSLLQVAQQAGQDPDQLLQLMAISDPRIEKIRQSLQPEKLTKLGEGEQLVSEKTGEVRASGKTKTEKPVSLSPGSSLVNPSTGDVLTTLPPAPAKPPDYGDRLESAAAAYGQNKYGKPTTFTDLLALDPIQASVLRQTVMVDEPTEIAAGKLAATIPEREKELLTTEAAGDLGVPFGTTKGEAKGIMPMTAQQRAAIASYDSARAIIADIRQYSEKVNQAGGGLKGRAQQSMKLWGAWTQSDPDAALLQSKAGELANLARSMGEKGALADKDVARAAALVPSVMDTREIAQKKLKDMSALIDEGETNFRKSLGIDARAPGTSKKAVPPPKPADPLAHIPVPDGLTPQQQKVYREAYAAEKAKKQKQMAPKAAK